MWPRAYSEHTSIVVAHAKSDHAYQHKPNALPRFRKVIETRSMPSSILSYHIGPSPIDCRLTTAALTAAFPPSFVKRVCFFAGAWAATTAMLQAYLGLACTCASAHELHHLCLYRLGYIHKVLKHSQKTLTRRTYPCKHAQPLNCTYGRVKALHVICSAYRYTARNPFSCRSQMIPSLMELEIHVSYLCEATWVKWRGLSLQEHDDSLGCANDVGRDVCALLLAVHQLH